MTELTLTGMGLIYSMLALTLVVALVIYGLKFWYVRLSKEKQNLTNEKEHLPRGSQSSVSIDGGLKSRNKYQELDVFAISRPIWMFGLGTAMLFTLFAFSWEQMEPEVYIPVDALEEIDEEQLIRTSPPPPPKPPPPPPPPPVEIEVTEELIEEDIKLESMEVDIETEIEEYEEVEEVAPPPPPPPPPPVDDKIEEIPGFVEEMPRFPGCEDIDGTRAEKDICAQQKMLEYVYSNVKYPAIARENGIEGRATLQFVVDENGNIKDINIVRDIPGGCGQAAEVMIQGMPQWIPGRQRGKKVKVRYTLPVVFELRN